MRALTRALEELYGSPPGEFTKKRDALAKELPEDDAAKLRARRKPTQIAWVLNQLARREPDAIAELTDAGRELARSERQALRGDKAGTFRASIARQRKIVTDLTHRAGALMRELGLDETGHLDEITSALQAALVDPEIGLRLEEGHLEKTPEAAVRFLGAGLGLPKTRNRKTRAKRDDAARRRAAAATRRAITKTRKSLREAEASVRLYRARAASAERRAEVARKHLDELTERASGGQRGP
jgi:hypothetical protein